MAKLERREFLHAAATLAAAAALRPHAAAAGESDRVKIGQIGTAVGGHAASTMRTLRELDQDFEVVGLVVDADDGGLSNDSAYEGIPRLTEAELLAVPGLRAVVVETAVAALIPTAARAVAAGLHVHVEKPGGHSHDEVKQLLADADGHKVHVEIGYFFRFHPTFQFLYRAVRAGWLGQPTVVHGEMSKAVFDARARQQFMATRRVPMFELGCYLCDALVNVAGKPDRITTFSRRDPTDGAIDNQLAVAEYPRCTATLRTSYREVRGDQRRQLVVSGDEGTIEILPLEGAPVLRMALSKPREQFRAEYQTVDLPAPRRPDERDPPPLRRHRARGRGPRVQSRARIGGARAAHPRERSTAGLSAPAAARKQPNTMHLLPRQPSKTFLLACWMPAQASLCAVCLLLAARTYPGYSLPDHDISYLGHPRLNPAGWLFWSLGIGLSGLMLWPIVAYMVRSVRPLVGQSAVRGRLLAAGTLAGRVACFGMVGLALIPQSPALDAAHRVAATLAMGGMYVALWCFVAILIGHAHCSRAEALLLVAAVGWGPIGYLVTQGWRFFAWGDVVHDTGAGARLAAVAVLALGVAALRLLVHCPVSRSLAPARPGPRADRFGRRPATLIYRLSVMGPLQPAQFPR